MKFRFSVFENVLQVVSTFVSLRNIVKIS